MESSSSSTSSKRNRSLYNEDGDDAEHGMTEEELYAYFYNANASEAVDIMPIFNIKRFHTKKVEHAAENAIKDYNQKNDTDFKVVEIEKARVGGGSHGFVFHIMFKVKPFDTPSSYPTTRFQAIVTYAFARDDFSIDLCRRSTSSRWNAAASSVDHLISNIYNLISVRLHFSSSNYNYDEWKDEMCSILKAHGLFGHIDEEEEEEEEEETTGGAAEAENNLSFEDLEWSYCDEGVIKVIRATLSPSALVSSSSCSARAIWLFLAKKDASIKARSIIENLQSMLCGIKKSNAESIEQYTQRIKHIVDKLAAASVSVKDIQVVICTLNGLSVEYYTFCNSIANLIPLLSVQQLNLLLEAEEKRIAAAAETETETETGGTNNNFTFAAQFMTQQSSSNNSHGCNCNCQITNDMANLNISNYCNIGQEEE